MALHSPLPGQLAMSQRNVWTKAGYGEPAMVLVNSTQVVHPAISVQSQFQSCVV